MNLSYSFRNSLLKRHPPVIQVLHRDAVSGGGYFMVGTVISADMDLIGQLQPHTRAQFVKVTMDEALKARRDRQTMLNGIAAALA